MKIELGAVRARGCRLLLVAAAIALAPIPASAQSFPYDQEMLLDVKPLPGSRRVPMLEVHADGKATLDMWCHSAAIEFAVTGGDLKLSFVSANPQNCTPERIALDQAMAKALLDVTGWRRHNDIIELVGSTTFRFRLSTH